MIVSRENVMKRPCTYLLATGEDLLSPESSNYTTSASTQIYIYSNLGYPIKVILGLDNFYLSNLWVGACQGCVLGVWGGTVILPSMTTLNHPRQMRIYPI